MTYTYKVFATTSMGNLRFESEAQRMASLFKMDAASDSKTVYAKATLQGDNLELVISGQFSAGLNEADLSLLKGLVSGMQVYRNGVLQESHAVSPPTSVAFFDMGQFVPSLYSGNDWFEGSKSANLTDAIDGMEGNDTFIGYGDNNFDWFYGGDGVDTSVYRGKFHEYTLMTQTSMWDDRTPNGTPTDQTDLPPRFVTGTLVGDLVKDRDGQDQLHSVERLVFQDMALALDLDGHAGTTAKVLGAVFGPASVQNKAYAGIGLSLLDKQTSYQQLLDLALNAALGADRSNGTVVELLYQNLVGVPPSPSERALYVNLIESGAHTQTSLAQFAADLDLNITNIDLVGLTQTGLAYWPVG